MPQWHEATRAWRESGELLVLGITQEQHRDRALLYAQWRGLDWPILWDPFNVTGSKAVPNVRFIDEHGILRSTRVRSRDFESKWLRAEFDAPDRVVKALESKPELLEASAATGARERGYWGALSALLWKGEEAIPASVAALERHAEGSPDNGAAWFRLGVARRMRHDSGSREPGDFQAAIDAWERALAVDPNQYIWRRRIQQYGPKLDKPYPFYDWVSEATRDIEARGETPVALAAPLSGAERVEGGRFGSPADAVEPDPEGRIDRAPDGLFEVEAAVAFDTSRKNPVARLHLELEPAAGGDGHWNNEAGPMLVWLAGGVPEGASLDRHLVELAPPGAPTSRERRRVEAELRLPDGAEGEHRLHGYALFNACRGEDGVCRYLRLDFEVEVRVP